MIYKAVTVPFRQLIAENSGFTCKDSREQNFQKLVKIMYNSSNLAPYEQHLRTQLVTDSRLEGISSTLYQEKNKDWRPMNHISRAPSENEKR